MPEVLCREDGRRLHGTKTRWRVSYTLSLLRKLTIAHPTQPHAPLRRPPCPRSNLDMLFYQLISHLATYFVPQQEEQRRVWFRVPAQPVQSHSAGIRSRRGCKGVAGISQPRIFFLNNNAGRVGGAGTWRETALSPERILQTETVHLLHGSTPF